jgi:ABC-type multidrug transport system fused ATPase/permease subunit
MMIHAPNATLSEIRETLAMVELDERIDTLEHGMDSELSIMGDPLNASEILRLKLAAAWLAQPHILVLNELFDTISYERRQRMFERLCAQKEITVLYFSNRIDLTMFDHFLLATPQEQYFVKDVEELRRVHISSQEDSK